MSDAVHLTNEAGAPLTMENGRLPVAALVMGMFEYAITSGWAFRARFSVTPTGPNDYFFYLKNNTTGQQLRIPYMELTNAAAKWTKIWIAPAVANLSALIDPVPVNLSGAAYAASSKAIMGSSVDLTTISGGSLLHTLEPGAATKLVLDWEKRPLVLQPGQVLVMQEETGTAAIDVLLDFFFSSGFDASA